MKLFMLVPANQVFNKLTQNSGMIMHRNCQGYERKKAMI